jgi:hypothetical protein
MWCWGVRACVHVCVFSRNTPPPPHPPTHVASKREVAIGYVRNDVIRLNPTQTEPISLAPTDKIVLISEDDGEYV